MGKVKKYELTLDDEQPFEVYGISTAFADYRLCWELNQTLGILLEKQTKRFEMFIPKLKAQHAFSYFFCLLLRPCDRSSLFHPNRKVRGCFISGIRELTNIL